MSIRAALIWALFVGVGAVALVVKLMDVAITTGVVAIAADLGERLR